MGKIARKIKEGFNDFMSSFEEKPKRNYISDSDIEVLREVAYFLSEMSQANLEKGKPIDGKKIKCFSEQIKIVILGITV